MSILPIATFPDNPILKKKAKEIVEVDSAIRRLVASMGETMYAAPAQGVGLAAPQVSESVRLFVYDIDWLAKENPHRHLRAVINPQIILTEGEQLFTEGCLSIPEFYEEVKRYRRVVMTALDLDGKPVTIDASDYHAVVLQHEYDHLDGVLFIDRLSLIKRRLYRTKLLKGKKP